MSQQYHRSTGSTVIVPRWILILNDSNVYIAFWVDSDTTLPEDYTEGIFIDDVIIKKCIGGTRPLDW